MVLTSEGLTLVGKRASIIERKRHHSAIWSH